MSMTELDAQIMELFRQMTVEQKQVTILSAALSSLASEQEASASGPESNPSHTA